MFMYIWIIAGHTPHESVTEFPAGPVRRRHRSPRRSPDDRCMHRMGAPYGFRTRRCVASPWGGRTRRGGPARRGRPGLSVVGFPTVLVVAVARAPRRSGALGARLAAGRVSIVQAALGLVDVGLHVEPGGLLHLIADLVEVDAAVVEERLRIETRPIRRRRRVVGHDPV